MKLSWKSEKKFFDSFFKQFLTNWGKNKDEKNWENEFDFWIIHIKVRLYGNFHENLVKKKFDTFLGNFWLIKAKMKMKMIKYREMFSIFEFSISKLGFVVIFMEIGVKDFWPIF